jgi:hypothetical protein
MTSRKRRVRPVVLLMLATLAVQICFTAAVRLVVVPRLTPALHWRYGLQRFSDSEVFQIDAAALAANLRKNGWEVLKQDMPADPGHIKILAALYYVTGSDNPWSVYLLNAILLSWTAALLYALLRALGIRPARSAIGAGAIACSPLVLFAHSEVLREPFILPQVLLYVLGLCLALEPGGERGFPRTIRAVLAATISALALIGASLLRPYLLLPLTLGMALAVGGVFVLILFGRGRGIVLEQALACAVVLAVVVGLYVRPSVSRVQRYRDASVLVPAGAAATSPDFANVLTKNGRAKVRLDQFERDVSGKTPEDLTRADFMVPHWCTVQWRATRGVPAALDAKLQSIACAREDYQRFCNTALLGIRADQHCDMTAFADAGGAIRHLPSATVFALLVPFPSMWFDGFGSQGTGLRRVGYIIDGLLDYTLLLGVGVFIWREARRQPHVVLLVAGIALMLALYGLAVPTQFILARLRLAIFIPLLGVGAAGWLTWIGGTPPHAR